MKRILAWSFLLMCVSPLGQAATVSVSPPASSVSLGQVFVLNVIGTGFPTTQGGGFDLTFDPAVLEITGVAIDPVWTFVNSTGVTDNVTGLLDEVKVSQFPGLSGDFVVAAITFLAKGAGVSTLGLGPATGNVWASGGVAIDPVFQAGSVAVTAVPLPAAFWLFGSGLLLLGGARSGRRG